MRLTIGQPEANVKFVEDADACWWTAETRSGGPTRLVEEANLCCWIGGPRSGGAASCVEDANLGWWTTGCPGGMGGDCGGLRGKYGDNAATG